MKVQISPLTFCFSALFLLLNHDRSLIAGLCAVIIHEAGHLIFIGLCGCQLEKLCITPIGLTISRSGITSHLQDLFINLSGPLFNLAAAGLFYWLAPSAANLKLSVTANLYFGLLNLLPILSLDGGKALKSLMMIKWMSALTERICQIISAFFLFLLWLLSAALLLMTDGSPSLLLFCIGLFLSQVTAR